MNKHTDPFKKKLLHLAEATGLAAADITGPSRRRDLVAARHALQYVAFTDHKMHPFDIALRCGTQRHAVHHSVKRVQGLLDVKDKQMTDLVATVRAA